MLNLFSTGVLTPFFKNKFGFGYPQTLALCQQIRDTPLTGYSHRSLKLWSASKLLALMSPR